MFRWVPVAGLSWNLPFLVLSLARAWSVLAVGNLMDCLLPVKSELMKNSSAALKTKLKQSNIFLRCPGPTFFLSGRDDRECVSSPKSQIRDFMSLGFLFDVFWAGRLNPNTRSGERKQRSEPTHTEGGKRRQDFGRPSSCVARIYLRTSDSCWKSCSTFSVFLPPPASLFGFVALLLGRSEWQ